LLEEELLEFVIEVGTQESLKKKKKEQTHKI
jgi:hypothetical protein